MFDCLNKISLFNKETLQKIMPLGKSHHSIRDIPKGPFDLWYFNDFNDRLHCIHGNKHQAISMKLISNHYPCNKKEKLDHISCRGCGPI